ncbi:hypothetical protein HXX76_009271 [Chlamydomonas incerta]|uniref:Uncharacterized protein n=1 Tax=Chlamydomonas incerta TaxID=51695 RepID=A0A835T3G7_CHLIN|nr:hypothetical protein HXX76_009271 [Chlamydomonas incerta]|eukprot:KAG2431775.1 hypothetical protein HXX76_009271 [Chlamydomonas incerta]
MFPQVAFLNFGTRDAAWWTNTCSQGGCSPAAYPDKCKDKNAQGLSHWGLDLGATCEGGQVVKVYPSSNTIVTNNPDQSTCMPVNSIKWSYGGLPSETNPADYFMLKVANVLTTGPIPFYVKGGDRFAVSTVAGPAICGTAPVIASRTFTLRLKVLWSMPGFSNTVDGADAGYCLNGGAGPVGSIKISIGGAAAFTETFNYGPIDTAASDAFTNPALWYWSRSQSQMADGTVITLEWTPGTDLSLFGGATETVVYTATYTVSAASTGNVDLAAFKITKSFNVGAKIFYDLPPVASPQMSRADCLALTDGSPAASAGWSVTRSIVGGASNVAPSTYTDTSGALTWSGTLTTKATTTLTGASVAVGASTDPVVITSNALLRTSDSVTFSQLSISAFGAVGATCAIDIPTLCLTVTRPSSTVSGQIKWPGSFGLYACAGVTVKVELTYTAYGATQSTTTPTTTTTGAYSFINLNLKPGSALSVAATFQLTSGQTVTETWLTSTASGTATTGTVTLPDLVVTTELPAKVKVFYDFTKTGTGTCAGTSPPSSDVTITVNSQAASYQTASSAYTTSFPLDSLSATSQFAAAVASAADYLVTAAPYKSTSTVAMPSGADLNLCTPTAIDACLLVSKKPVTGSIKWESDFGAYSCAGSTVTVEITYTNNAGTPGQTATATVTNGVYTFDPLDILAGSSVTVAVKSGLDTTKYTFASVTTSYTYSLGTFAMPDIKVDVTIPVEVKVFYDFANTGTCPTSGGVQPPASEVAVTIDGVSPTYNAGTKTYSSNVLLSALSTTDLTVDTAVTAATGVDIIKTTALSVGTVTIANSADLCAPPTKSSCLLVTKKPVTGSLKWTGNFGAYTCPAADDNTASVALQISYTDSTGAAQSTTTTINAAGTYTFPVLDIAEDDSTLKVEVVSGDIASAYTYNAAAASSVSVGNVLMSDIVVDTTITVDVDVWYDFESPFTTCPGTVSPLDSEVVVKTQKNSDTAATQSFSSGYKSTYPLNTLLTTSTFTSTVAASTDAADYLLATADFTVTDTETMLTATELCTKRTITSCLTVGREPVTGSIKWAGNFGTYGCPASGTANTAVTVVLSYTNAAGSPATATATVSSSGEYTFAPLAILAGTAISVAIKTGDIDTAMYTTAPVTKDYTGDNLGSIKMPDMVVDVKVKVDVAVYYDLTTGGTGACPGTDGAPADAAIVVKSKPNIDGASFDTLAAADYVQEYAISALVNPSVTFTAKVEAASAASIIKAASPYQFQQTALALPSTLDLCKPVTVPACLLVSKKPVIEGAIKWAGNFGKYSCTPEDGEVTVTLTYRTSDMADGATPLTTTVKATNGDYSFPPLDVKIGAPITLTVDSADVHSTYTITPSTTTSITSVGTTTAADIVISRDFEVAGTVRYDFGTPKAGTAGACKALNSGFPALDEVSVAVKGSSDRYAAGVTGADAATGAFAYTIAMADIQPRADVVSAVSGSSPILTSGFYISDTYAVPAAAPGGNTGLCTPAPIEPCLAVGKQFTVTIGGEAWIELNDDVTNTVPTFEQLAKSGCVPGLKAQLYKLSGSPLTREVTPSQEVDINANGKYSFDLTLASGDPYSYQVRIITTAASDPFSVYYGSGNTLEYRTVDFSSLVVGGNLVVDSAETVTGPKLYVTRTFTVQPKLSYDLAPPTSTQTKACGLSNPPRAQDVKVTASYSTAAGNVIANQVDSNGKETVNYASGTVAFTATNFVSVASQHVLVRADSAFITTSGDLKNFLTVASDVCSAVPISVCLTVGLKSLKVKGAIQWNMQGISTGPYTCGSSITAVYATTTTSASPIADGSWAITLGQIYPDTDVTLDAALAAGLSAKGISITNDNDADVDYTIDTGVVTVTNGAATAIGGRTIDTVTTTEVVLTIPDYTVERSFDVSGTVRYAFKNPSGVVDNTATCAAAAGAYVSPTTDYVAVTPTGPAFSSGYDNTGAFAFTDISASALTSMSVAVAATSTAIKTDSPYKSSYTSQNFIDLVKADLCKADYGPICLTVGLADLQIKTQVNWELTATSGAPSATDPLEGPSDCAIPVKLSGTIPAGFPVTINGASVSGAATASANTGASGIATFTLVNALPSISFAAEVAVPSGAVYSRYLTYGTTSGLVPAVTYSVPADNVMWVTRQFALRGSIFYDCTFPAAGAATCTGKSSSPANDAVAFTATAGTAAYSAGTYTVNGLTLGSVTLAVAAVANKDTYTSGGNYLTIRTVDVTAAFKAAFNDNLAAARAGLCGTTATTTTTSTPLAPGCLSVGKLVALNGRLWIERGTESPSTYASGTDGLFGCAAMPFKVTTSNGVISGASTGTISTSDGTFSARVVAGGTYSVTILDGYDISTTQCGLQLTRSQSGSTTTTVTSTSCGDLSAGFPYVEFGSGPGIGLTHGYWGQNIVQARDLRCTDASATNIYNHIVFVSSVGSYNDVATSTPYKWIAPTLGPLTKKRVLFKAAYDLIQANAARDKVLNAVAQLMTDGNCTASNSGGVDNMIDQLRCQAAANQLSFFRNPLYGFEWRQGWTTASGKPAPASNGMQLELDQWALISHVEDVLAANTATPGTYSRSYLENLKNTLATINQKGEPNQGPTGLSVERMCKPSKHRRMAM